jgi:Mn-dependent DtxR family transcriptional regulator
MSSKSHSRVLGAVYELTGRQMACGVSVEELAEELDLSTGEVEQILGTLADDGVIEWCTFGHVGLTRVGLRRATRLEPRPSGME